MQYYLSLIDEHVTDPQIRHAMAGQLLSQILASEDIPAGFKVVIPITDQAGNPTVATYTVDKKFDLWHGIPAYGLSSSHEAASPIILFRSTKSNLSETKVLASLLTNLHPKGVAWNTFKNCRQEVREWLEKETQSSGHLARAIGFSQGGALAKYFVTYDHDLFSKEGWAPSLTFGAPATSSSVKESYENLSAKPHLESYITRGDVVPKVGESLFGTVYQVTSTKDLPFPKSHSTLSLLDSSWSLHKVDVELENKSHIRDLVSSALSHVGKVLFIA
mgnify:CR=1 FL=1